MVITNVASRSDPEADKSVTSQYELFIKKYGGGQKWLIILSALLIAFPFLQILPLSAEAQPLFLFSIFLWIIVRLRARMVLFIYLGFFVFPLSIGIFLYSITAVIDSLVAVVTPIFLYEFIRGERKILVAWIIVASSIFYLLLAFMQAFLPISVNEVLLSPLKFFVPRMTLSPLSDWDRGISIIASEPSTMAPMIFMVFAASIFLNSRGYRSTIFGPVLIGAACLFMIFQTKALTSLVLLLGFLLSISLHYVLKLRIQALLAGVTAVLIFAFVVGYFFTLPERVTALFGMLKNADSIFYVLDRVSSSRLTLSMGPYCNLFSAIEYTPALGAWSEHSYEVSRCLPLDYVDSERYKITGGDLNGKPPSIISLLFLDLGPIAILAFVWFGVLVLRAVRRSNIINSPWPLAFVVTSLFFIIVGGFPLTIPAFWVSLFFFID